MFIQVSCQTFGIRNLFSQQETACQTGESLRTAPAPRAVMPAWENGHGDLARSGEISGSPGIKFAATVRPRRCLRCRLRKRFAFVARENRYPPSDGSPSACFSGSCSGVRDEPVVRAIVARVATGRPSRSRLRPRARRGSGSARWPPRAAGPYW